MLKLYFKWFLQAWPILIFIPICFIHSYLRDSFSSLVVDKSFALLAQIVGGGLILYSIDSNLKVLNKNKLLSRLSDYFKSFPIKQSATATVTGVESKSYIGDVKIKVTKNPVTMKQKIAYLQEQINILKDDVKEDILNVHSRITNQHAELSTEITNIKLETSSFNSKFEDIFSSQNGVKIQFFGVLLLVYGAIVGFIPDIKQSNTPISASSSVYIATTIINSNEVMPAK